MNGDNENNQTGCGREAVCRGAVDMERGRLMEVGEAEGFGVYLRGRTARHDDEFGL